MKLTILTKKIESNVKMKREKYIRINEIIIECIKKREKLVVKWLSKLF